MATFDEAVRFVLKHEGGYVNHPRDPGGATNYGISLRFLRTLSDEGDINYDGIINADDIKALTEADAIQIYKKYFWDKYKIERYSGPLCILLLDMYVNMPPIQAMKVFQRALNKVNPDYQIAVDGIYGMHTWKSVEIAQKNEASLLNAIKESRVDYYMSLVSRRPELRYALKGWINRASDLPA